MPKRHTRHVPPILARLLVLSGGIHRPLHPAALHVLTGSWPGLQIFHRFMLRLASSSRDAPSLHDLGFTISSFSKMELPFPCIFLVYSAHFMAEKEPRHYNLSGNKICTLCKLPDKVQSAPTILLAGSFLYVCVQFVQIVTFNVTCLSSFFLNCIRIFILTNSNVHPSLWEKN